MKNLFGDEEASERKPAPAVHGGQERDRHSTNDHRERIFNFVRSQGRHGATDAEIQAALRMDGNSERPRRIELESQGRIVRTSRKRSTDSGHHARVYVTAEFARNIPEKTRGVPLAGSQGALPPGAVRQNERSANIEREWQFGEKLDTFAVEEIELLASSAFPGWPSAFGRDWTADTVRSDKVCRRVLLLKLQQREQP
ncbi:hypothetical protein [Thalassoroseus pseudoceratinae]|uniref:hypothetical protein n=1 Tax=Thalassoroseus pseudoceratinae TaxID=2713176 RepID=UPI0014207428|nr:hypothetical protein [Thalassoroseus pseudoceratinae]